jgi:hypothetical protein
MEAFVGGVFERMIGTYDGLREISVLLFLSQLWSA